MDHPTVIVTGASRGLGAATARLAARLGADVVLAARSIDQLESEAQKIRITGRKALPVQSDISREGDCRVIIQQTLDHFGRIDALVNNGGVVEPIAPIAEVDIRDWERNFAVNVLGMVMLTQMALPHLRRTSGRVVNITSGAAVSVVPGWGAYSLAKAALNHFTQILAAEEPQITALALWPGLVDTDMQATIREKGEGHMGESNYNFLSGLYQQGKLLPPEVPGRAIACLALNAPHDWSGQVIEWGEERVQELVKDCFP